MNTTTIHSKTADRGFKKNSFPILTIALWALLLYAGFKIIWNYSGPQGQKTIPAINVSEKS